MQALTMYRAIQAAALIAPTADEAAHTAARLFAARQALPPTFTRAADFWESTEITYGAEFHRDTAHAEALGELLETASCDMASKHATFKHAAGRVKMLNTRERLQGFAADMLKGAAWALWGGGEKPAEVSKPRKARTNTWRAGLVKVAAEALQDGQAADFLAVAMGQLGGLAYMHEAGNPFVVYAPDHAEGLPDGFAVARKCSGEWVTMHMASGLSVGRAQRVKAQALESGMSELQVSTPEQLARALAAARQVTEAQHAEALAAWRAAHGIAAEVPETETEAQGEELATEATTEAAPVSEDMAAIIATAATVAIATAQAQAAETCAPAETDTAAELVTCDGPELTDAEATAPNTPPAMADAIGADHTPADATQGDDTDPLKTRAHAGGYTQQPETLRADYLRAADGGNTQQASSKTGAWSAVMFRTADGRAGLAFKRPGHPVELADHTTGGERMRALQTMAQAAEKAHQQASDDSAPVETQDASDTGPEFQRARPAHVDLRAVVAQGLAVAELVGLGVHYTGDMANSSGNGAIVEASDDGRGGLYVCVTLEDGRHMTHLHASSFSDSPGSRFALDYKRHGAPYLAELAATRATLKATTTSAKELGAQRHAAELVRLAAEFPQLERADSRHAGGKMAARNIRTMLKAAFPGQKFSVTSDYSSVNVRWVDGPTDAAVTAIVDRFNIGRADYNTDYFYTEDSAWSELFGGVQYLFTHRDESPELLARVLEDFNAKYSTQATLEDWRKQGGIFSYTQRDADAYRQWFRKMLNATDATPPAKTRRSAKA